MNQKAKEPSEFSQPKPRQQPQTMKCFIVPVDQMELIRDVMREAPYKSAAPIIAGLAQLQIADVPIGPPPEQ